MKIRMLAVGLAVLAGVQSAGCKTAPQLAWWKKPNDVGATAVAHAAPQDPAEAAKLAGGEASPFVSGEMAVPGGEASRDALAAAATGTSIAPSTALGSFASTASSTVPTQNLYPSTDAAAVTPEAAVSAVSSTIRDAVAQQTTANLGTMAMAMPYDPNAVPGGARDASVASNSGGIDAGERYASTPISGLGAPSGGTAGNGFGESGVAPGGMATQAESAIADLGGGTSGGDRYAMGSRVSSVADRYASTAPAPTSVSPGLGASTASASPAGMGSGSSGSGSSGPEAASQAAAALAGYRASASPYASTAAAQPAQFSPPVQASSASPASFAGPSSLAVPSKNSVVASNASSYRPGGTSTYPGGPLNGSGGDAARIATRPSEGDVPRPTSSGASPYPATAPYPTTGAGGAGFSTSGTPSTSPPPAAAPNFSSSESPGSSTSRY